MLAFGNGSAPQQVLCIYVRVDTLNEIDIADKKWLYIERRCSQINVKPDISHWNAYCDVTSISKEVIEGICAFFIKSKILSLSLGEARPQMIRS